jgi:hypothetical protein
MQHEWVNIGDMDPRQGTTLIKDVTLEENGDFRCSGITITPESNVGGTDKVFLIHAGDLFLSKKNMNSAFETVGARLEGDMILTPTFDMDVSQTPLGSKQGMLDLANAANAFGSVEPTDYDVLVQIGQLDEYDADPKFTGEVIIYAEGTEMWAILRDIVHHFNDLREDDPQEALQIGLRYGDVLRIYADEDASLDF